MILELYLKREKNSLRDDVNTFENLSCKFSLVNSSVSNKIKYLFNYCISGFLSTQEAFSNDG